MCDLDSSRSSSGAGGDSDTPDAVCPHINPPRPVQHYGSFYLRMGAVAFGIGSMIYSGLEFGQYFELERNTKCHNIMLALTPATRMAFIFIQMYFIFLNNEVSARRTASLNDEGGRRRGQTESRACGLNLRNLVSANARNLVKNQHSEMRIFMKIHGASVGPRLAGMCPTKIFDNPLCKKKRYKR